MSNVELKKGNCLELMKEIKDKSIDLILCDLPYGTTACKWDTIIPFDKLWEQYERIIKDNGAIVLTASQPFTSALVMSNIKLFRYEWIFIKSSRGGLYANKMPIKNTENICIFYKKQPVYNPILREGFKPYKKQIKIKTQFNNKSVFKDVGIKDKLIINNGTRQPVNNISFKVNNYKSLHPTQKPVALFEYLIKTYSNEGDLILDNCAGSGTTGIACQNLNRNCILIELDDNYCEIIEKRLKENSLQKSLNDYEEV